MTNWYACISVFGQYNFNFETTVTPMRVLSRMRSIATDLSVPRYNASIRSGSVYINVTLLRF